MFGRKTGLFAALTVAMLLFGGCGNAGANLGGTTGGRNGGYNTGSYSSGGTAYWDGYGINGGRAMNGSGYNGAYFDTYGASSLNSSASNNGSMNGNNGGNTLGQDMRNTWDDLTGTGRTNTALD